MKIVTTYLWTSKIRGQDELKAEHKVPITKDYYIHGKPLDGTDCKILLNMEANKSLKSKPFYLNYWLLLWLLKLVSKNILVGSVQYVGGIIPVVIILYRHRFEAYTLVSESHDNMNMVMGVKNMYYIEGVLSTRELYLHFLNRSIPFFPKMDILLKPKEKCFIEFDMPI